MDLAPIVKSPLDDYRRRVITSSDTLIGVSGFGHIDPKKHLLGEVKNGQAPEKCPCGSKECEEDYKRQKEEMDKIIEAFVIQSEKIKASKNILHDV